MTTIKNYFMFSPDPGGVNGDGTSNEEEKEITETTPADKEQEEHKPLGEKIKEALQDWSNKDQADQDFDDTRV